MEGSILGPYLLEATFACAIYLELTRNDLIPALITLYTHLKEFDLFQEDTFILQNGAPPHNAAPVCACFHEVFPNRWIVKSRIMEFPFRQSILGLNRKFRSFQNDEYVRR